MAFSHNHMIPIVMVTFSTLFTCVFFFFDFGKKYDERSSSLRLPNSYNDIVDFGFSVAGEDKEKPQEEQSLSLFEHLNPHCEQKQNSNGLSAIFIFLVQHTSCKLTNCTATVLFVFYLQQLLLVCNNFLHLQQLLFICSNCFLFAATLYYCDVTLLGHRSKENK